ncbi:recombinase family protein [Streptomyces sp. 769]|uniref:recombinase family protein n=1 Tax=Streptomyces sp. 769 TaxID=1262452 RepID=UPI0005820B4C|nr:recombinase family protein [Streptomyces sp. 769]AJC60173.1 resolvase domain-containing protein [Streptomyces sp. 769]
MTSAALLERATETALTAGTVTGRKVLRAVIYARVSSDPHNRGKSVADQVAECKRECAHRGWHLVEVFEDNDRSASLYATKERKDYARLVEFLRAGKADVLMTWESSRAQRDLEAYLRLREIAEGNGVQWCYKGRLYDLSRTDDRFTTGLDALLDERESGITRDRVLRGKKASAAKGRPNGRMLYGYAREYDPRTGEFVKSVMREDQAAVVREAVRRVAGGETLTALCREFNQRGLRTNTGKHWWPYTLRAMVTNPGYLGKRVRHGAVIGKAEWPAILKTAKEVQAFYACVQRLGDPARTTTRPGGVKHMMTGLGTCGVCGGKLAASYRAQTVGQGDKRPTRYGCRGTAVEGGFCVSMEKTALDRYISDLVIARLSRPDAAELLADDSEKAEEAAALLAEAAEKRATLDETADKVAAGEMTVAMAARIEAKLLPEVEALEERARSLSTAPVLRGLIRADIAEVWPTLPIARQREVIKALMDVTLMPSSTQDPETARQMRRELGSRIRQLRKDYGLLGMTARRLAELARWPRHKVENAEVGKQTPTADEVRLLCCLLEAESEADKLIALIPARRLPPTKRVEITWKHDL